MKPFLSASYLLKNAVLLIALLSGCCMSYAQISESIYKAVPDSIKPVNRNALSTTEKRTLLHYGSFFLSQELCDSLLPLATMLEQDNLSEKDPDTALLNLNAVFTYYFNNQNLNPYALKYADALLEKLDTSPPRQELYWETMSSKGYLMVSAGNFEEGINVLITTLDHYRSTHDSLGMSDLSVYLAHAYYDMDLFNEAIQYTLDARRYLKKGSFYKQSDLQLQVELGIYYLNLCEHDPSGIPCRQSELLFNQVLSDPDVAQWKAYVYANMSWKKYLEKQYATSVSYADSAMNKVYFDEDPYPLLTRNTAMTYKGLSLVETGAVAQGSLLLKKVVVDFDNCPGCVSNRKSYMDATYKLYQLAEGKGQWAEAMTYLKKYQKIKDQVNVLGNRAGIFIANRKFSLSQRDARIKKLEFEQKLSNERQSRSVLIVVIMALLLLSLILLFYNRQRQSKIRQMEANKAIQEEKRLHNEDLIRLENNMVRLQQDAVMAQRRKISEDMHDDLSSSLAGLRFYITDIKTGSPSDEVKTAMTNIEAEVTTIYQNARQYMHSLNQNTQLQYDLAAYLKELKSKMSENTTLFLDVQFREADIKGHLSADQHYHLYHIIREAIANIVKHSTADRAFVHVDINEDACIFSIGDNGKGFDPVGQSGLSSGMGVQNVVKRVKDMDGHIEIHSDGKGTIIRGSFPLYAGRR